MPNFFEEIGNEVGGFVDNTLGTNFSGNNANELAAAAQARATADANRILGESFQDQRQILNPYYHSGTGALNALAGNSFIGNWQQDPGYQFQLSEGNRAINNAAAARGMGNSGATLKALTQYGQNLASQEYGKVYDREFGRASLLAGMGENAAGQMSQNSGAYGASVSNNLTGLGDAQAAAAIGRSNQTQGFVGGLFGLAGSKGEKAVSSDRRLKTNIEEIPLEEIKEFRESIRPYLFEYISEDHGSGVWPGVMAQDLEKSRLGRTIVFKNEKGEKQIDIRKTISLLLALEAGV